MLSKNKEASMRVLSKEYQEHLKKNEIYQFIMNQPRPDFTELNKECEKVENSMHKAQEEDRKKMMEALHR